MLMEHYVSGEEPDFMKSEYYHFDGSNDYMDNNAPDDLKKEFETYKAERERIENELVKKNYPYLFN